MKRELIIALLLILLTNFVASDTVERSLTLQPGGNIIGLDVEVSFEEDLKHQCTFGTYSGEYIWTNYNSGWNNPDIISPLGGGYIVGLNQDSECEINLGEFEEDEVRENLRQVDLNQGWNLINLYSDMDVIKLWNECGRWDGIRPYTLSETDTRVGFFILSGNEWHNPLGTDYSVNRNDGAYVYIEDGTCSANLNKNFVEFDAEMNQGEVSEENDLEIKITELKAEHEEYVEEDELKPSFKIAKSDSGDINEDYELDWKEESLTVDWDTLWAGEPEESVGINITLEENREENYWWDSQEVELGEINITRCGQNHAFSDFQDSCVKKNSNIDTAQIEEDTNWTVHTQENTVHVLENLDAASTDSGHELSIDTGTRGYCGGAYFENDNLKGEKTFKLNMESVGDEDQGPQEAFVSVDGEKETFDIDAGDAIEHTKNIEEGKSVKVGLSKDTSSSCSDVYKRTDLDVEISDTE